MHAAVRVDRQHAGLHGPRGPQGLADISRPDRSGQAVGRGICQADRFLFRVEWNDRHDRPEDLLARDAHVVGDMVEDRRHQVCAINERLVVGHAAADHQLCALLLADRDELAHAFALALADERPHLRLSIGRIAHLHSPGRV